jgi:hypothetical protein
MAATQEGPKRLEPLRYGSRWLYAPPSEEDVKTWFDGQRLHPGMAHEPYYGGIVLIGAKEKIQQTFENANGTLLQREIERMTFTPYVKVDTRIAYFHDLIAALNAEDPFKYIPVIEPVPVKIITDRNSPYYNEHLPEGYFMFPVRNNTERESFNRYIGARWRVAIYEADQYMNAIAGKEPRPLIQGVGTKQSLLVKQYADDNVLMKAETGAIGRALGVAGILVVGTGIATAEDMQEFQSAPPPGQAAGDITPLPEIVAPSEPQAGVRQEGPEAEGQVNMPGVNDQGAVVPDESTPQERDEEMRARARTLSDELKSVSPAAHAAYVEWYTKERQFPALDQLSGPALNGAVVALERKLDEARQASTA